MFNKKLHKILILFVFSTISPFYLYNKYAQHKSLSNIYKNKSNLFSFNFTKLWDNRIFSLFRRQAQLYKNKQLVTQLDPKKDPWMKYKTPSEIKERMQDSNAFYKGIYIGEDQAARIDYHRRPKDPSHFSIGILETDKRHREQGYARALLDYAINDAINKGAKIISLGTSHDNFKAISLYESMGFVQNPKHASEYIYTVPQNKIKPIKTDIFWRE